MSFEIIWAFKSSWTNSANMFLFNNSGHHGGSCHIVVIIRSGSLICIVEYDNLGIVRRCMSCSIMFQINVFGLEQQITWDTFVLQKYFRYCPMNLLKVFGKFTPGDMTSVADPASKNSFGNTFRHFRVFLACFGQCWKRHMTYHVGLQASHRLELFVALSAVVMNTGSVAAGTSAFSCGWRSHFGFDSGFMWDSFMCAKFWQTFEAFLASYWWKKYGWFWAT